MVWQKGVIPFTGFFSIFVPSVVNYIVPAVIMYFAIPKESPKQSDEKVGLKRCISVYFSFLRNYHLNCNKSSEVPHANNFWNDHWARCIIFLVFI